jgi:crotonobetainyl-CoA:carnitine CoA-transferase CaiB-like acyl-CoA transferase
MDNQQKTKGPLEGIRVIEFAGLGPSPMCGMLLADMGAAVTIIDRPIKQGSRDIPMGGSRVLRRGKCSIALDLKFEQDRHVAFDLINVSDILLEGCRPGVMERLGFGPDVCLMKNPRLVFGRLSG